MVDIEGILEEVVVKVIGHASRKNTFWFISMDRDCSSEETFGAINTFGLSVNIGPRSGIALTGLKESISRLFHFY
jgi:hypothetical protein